ncbi:hypothetical protein DL771_004835 [Monosporascus sp. 5C6A]|nr:hypothetical protein DL771_004835 [Monosporascus sp. 5C6A]
MPGHRPSSSLTKLMFEHHDPEQPPEPTGSATTWKSSSSPSVFTPEKQRRPRRTVSLCVFVSSLLGFCVLALALGLGLGLGLGRRRDRAAYAPPPPFSYSSYYGISEGLESVPIERLVNATELDLDTGFSVEGAGGRSAVREYVFNISQALAAPDGFQKPMILVNGQSPGPLIEANAGDTVRVHVNNLMANWSTTIHWHGINQKGTTWMDGVMGVSQCAIPPGRSFTYEFRVVDQRGTFWWHAHLSVIHDPDELVPETDAEKIIFVSDVYHTHGSVLLASYLKPTSKWVPFESGVEPLPDNLLLNGQNTYDCSVTSTTYPPEQQGGPASAPQCTGGRRYATRVRPGSTVRLRLINASSFLSYWFSIDNHTLTIVELDGVEVAPLEGQRGVYLNVGQRVSVSVRADAPGPPGNYIIRATLPRTCFLPYAPYASAGLERSAAYEARGVLSYDGAPDPDPDADEPVGIVGGGSGGRNTSNPYGVENNGVRGDVWEGCDDMPFDVPKPMRAHRAVEVVSEANMHYIEYMFRQAQDVNRIFINKTAYSPLPNNATLWKALEQDFTAESANSYNSWDFGLNQQVLLIPEADKGVQIVINSRDAMEHPWHLQKAGPPAHSPSPAQIFSQMKGRTHNYQPLNHACMHTNATFLPSHLLPPLTRPRSGHAGHTFQIVGWGGGLFGETSKGENGGSTTGTTWNLENPMRRDTVTVPAFSHVVIRFVADNPGLWALHVSLHYHPATRPRSSFLPPSPASLPVLWCCCRVRGNSSRQASTDRDPLLEM